MEVYSVELKFVKLFTENFKFSRIYSPLGVGGGQTKTIINLLTQSYT